MNRTKCSKNNFWEDNMKKITSVIIAFVTMLALSVTSFAAYRAKAGTSGWTSKDEWYLWSQGASSSSVVRQVGCRTVAYAKLIAEAGYANFANPDEFSTYLVNNGLVNDSYQETTAGKAPDMYTNGAIKFCGKESLTYNWFGKKYYYSKKTVNKKIMNLLNDGYYLCLMGPSHTTYVLRGASLDAGKALISDSWADWAYSSYANEIAYTKYNLAKFNNIWKFKVEPKQESVVQTEMEEVTIPDGAYNIQSNNYLLVEVANNDAWNGANIRLNTWYEDTHELYIYNDGTGWYRIKHIYSGRNLAVEGEVAGNGANVILWDEYNSDAQRWKFFKNGDGLYIKNALGYYLDINKADLTAGSNIQTWEKNDSLAQKFYVTKIDGYGMISYNVDHDLVINWSQDYDDSTAVGSVNAGEIVKLCERNGKFAYIRYRNILEGWCSGKYVVDV